MIISFDLGTTRLKVAAFDTDGTLVAHHAMRHDENPDRVQSGEADGWWQAAVRGTREVITRSGRTAKDITAFSLSGRAGACVVVDDEGHVIRQPWSDRRHQPQLDDLTKTGEHSLYGATLIAKYQWLLDNEPQIAAKATKLLYAKDTLCFRLTGETVTDPSSGPDTSDWPDGVPIDRSLLPTVQLPWTKAGEVTPAAAQQLGCAAGIPVAVGAHDGVSANIGAGVISTDSAAITLGTHAVCRRVMRDVSDSVVFEDVTRFYGFPPDRHIYGANALAVGQTIDWWLATSGKDLASANATLERHRKAGVIGSHGLRFSPYLAGQLHPEKQASGNGAFTGLALQHNLDDMTQAVFEGCARAIAVNFAHLIDRTGSVEKLAFTGGGTVFTPWLQMIVDTIGQPVAVTDAYPEARGAAMCAAVMLGIYPDIDVASAAMLPAGDTITPSELSVSYKQL